MERDATGKILSVMCPLCFFSHEAKSAREGGVLMTDTKSGMMTDVDLGCGVDEFLVRAAMMG